MGRFWIFGILCNLVWSAEPINRYAVEEEFVEDFVEFATGKTIMTVNLKLCNNVYQLPSRLAKCERHPTDKSKLRCFYFRENPPFFAPDLYDEYAIDGSKWKPHLNRSTKKRVWRAKRETLDGMQLYCLFEERSYPPTLPSYEEDAIRDEHERNDAPTTIDFYALNDGFPPPYPGSTRRRVDMNSEDDEGVDPMKRSETASLNRLDKARLADFTSSEYDDFASEYDDLSESEDSMSESEDSTGEYDL